MQGEPFWPCQAWGRGLGPWGVVCPFGEQDAEGAEGAEGPSQAACGKRCAEPGAPAWPPQYQQEYSSSQAALGLGGGSHGTLPAFLGASWGVPQGPFHLASPSGVSRQGPRHSPPLASALRARLLTPGWNPDLSASLTGVGPLSPHVTLVNVEVVLQGLG